MRSVDKRPESVLLFVMTTVVPILLLLFGCSGGDPSPAETDGQKKQKILTAGTWSTQTVEVDNVDKTSIYDGLKLSFTNTAYTATNGGAIWGSNGTWQFTDDTGSTIQRGDGLLITVNEITNNKLVLTLYWNDTTLGNGRATSVDGEHVFTFTK